MNFFGHAVMAAWHRPEPSFALGAMLPDLAQMLGYSRVESDDDLLAQGLAFHHLTDRVFHSSAVFTTLESSALQDLRAAGLPAGPRRAIAHVGLELLLDAELSRIPECLNHYRAALDVAASSALRARIRWSRRRPGNRTGASSARDLAGQHDPGLVELCRALSQRAVRLRPQTSEEVVERLGRILDPRPRLAIPASCRASVNQWVQSTWPILVQRLPGWLEELRAGLQPAPHTAHPPRPVFTLE